MHCRALGKCRDLYDIHELLDDGNVGSLGSLAPLPAQAENDQGGDGKRTSPSELVGNV